MTIRKFKFHDKLRGWKLNEVSFGNFNLLVGLSGVGKSQIIEKLNSICHVGLTSQKEDVYDCEWKLDISIEGFNYIWEVAMSSVDRDRNDIHLIGAYDVPYFIKEKVICNGEEIVSRSKDKFLWSKDSLPKLSKNESAITLLRDEDIISPLYKALKYFIFRQISSFIQPFDKSSIKRLRHNYPTLDSLRRAKDVIWYVKAYILQEDYPSEFELIKEQYKEIFKISDIKIGTMRELEPLGFQIGLPIQQEWFAVGIKEFAMSDWITNNRISSGMLKTLLYLLEIYFAPKGSVIMIDDFENSMGQNCLPQLTDYILRYSNDIQFILTSHHPYVINNIPTKWWKIVTRKGSEVTVKDADSIPALKTGSKLDKFTLLMNLKEYEEGIQ
ncbi:MAG: hypothetical protein BWK80_49650 [Desulfobacteraceae bacterium IS3]|nr:MAG: hypothetical protein BWK80_49650 [Desulfobacteraceae bacterium IS3]